MCRKDFDLMSTNDFITQNRYLLYWHTPLIAVGSLRYFIKNNLIQLDSHKQINLCSLICLIIGITTFQWEAGEKINMNQNQENKFNNFIFVCDATLMQSDITWREKLNVKSSIYIESQGFTVYVEQLD